MVLTFGSYRHKIVFQEPSTTIDGSGFISAASTNTYEVFADVRPMNGDRALRYGQEIGVNPVEVYMRYNNQFAVNGFSFSEIRAGVLFTWEGKSYVVHSVVDPGYRQKHLKLIAFVRSVASSQTVDTGVFDATFDATFS